MLRISAVLAAVLLLQTVASSADFNLPAAPSVSLAHGSNATVITYRGQTNYQFSLYASSNFLAWTGLTTNLCTSPQMTFSETNRQLRFYKGAALKTPQIYTCSISQGDTASFALFARTNDTIALVAKRFSLTPKALAAENDLKVTASIKPGRKLILPDGFKDKGPIKEIQKPVAVTPVIPPPVETPPGQFNYPRPTPQTPAPQTPRPYTAPTQTPVTPQPYSPPPNLRPSLPAPSTGGPLSDNQVTAQGRGRFNWPLRGDIISDFGPKGTGQRNDGINIRAVAGEAIRSAAAGDIVYAGDQVPGFGNLVLIKHADGWVTAYGHLARVDVKMQQRVAQGQQIGQAGTSGGVGEPQLHFEVRYAPSPTERARPVDPKLVLGR